jgi:hypothetical protein
MFHKLVDNLAALLENKIDPCGSMDRNEKLETALEQLKEVDSFDALTAALRPLRIDRGVSLRLADLERCAAERVWLSSDSRAYLTDWYAECAEDLRGTRQIARMVSDVKAALPLPEGKEPNMARWSTKQKRLWELERGLDD